MAMNGAVSNEQIMREIAELKQMMLALLQAAPVSFTPVEPVIKSDFRKRVDACKADVAEKMRRAA